MTNPMKTIPFTIEGCKSNNNEAVTRCGRRVRIVGCENPFHAYHEYRVVGYIENRVYPSSWTISGTCSGGDSGHDLFLPGKESKLRPWTIKEVPHLAMVRHHKDEPRFGTIVGVNSTGDIIIAGNGSWSLQDLCKSFEHSIDHGLTWSPCGVAE
jgi:hypothetical protein